MIIMCAIINATILQASILIPLQRAFFPVIPNIVNPPYYLFVQRLIVNTVFGLIIGLSQRLLLKKMGTPAPWWIAMSTIAYALTTFWWYYYEFFIE